VTEIDTLRAAEASLALVSYAKEVDWHARRVALLGLCVFGPSGAVLAWT
jgi:hypothetical protein